MPDDELESLREAVRESPKNASLRRHLAERLLLLGRAEEAEREARTAMSLAPADDRARIVLARAFLALGRLGEAGVVVEEILRSPRAPAAAYVLHARLLLAEGDPGHAARQYRRAVEEDPTVADEMLAERLGVAHEPSEPTEVVDGRVRASMEEGTPAPSVETERPRITFADVGGMESLKEEIRLKVVHPIRHPEVYEAYGKKVGGGILMYGPPGCGKTHLARATAGEVSAAFLAVGIHDVLDMWIGNSEKSLHGLFARAREARPCVMFFDEVDALGSRRSDIQGAGRHLVNQFLAELDGLGSSNEGVLVLAATNAPWHLDPAFRRPGRFDRILFVPPPDEPARGAILRILLKGRLASDVDVDHVAKKSAGCSGADLASVVDVAVEKKIGEALRAGKPLPLTTKDLVAAAKQVKPSTKDWFATARNHAIYANQGGIYDDVLAYLERNP